MRLLLTLSAYYNWEVHSFDFVAAYLNSPIDEDVWVKPPEGMDVPKGYGLHLKKALYGTQQAARGWWKYLKSVLANLGYVSSQYDNSLYVLQHQANTGVVWVHVDDGIVTGSSAPLIRKLEADLKGALEIKWSEGLTSIVGFDVTRTVSGFSLHQSKVINSLLQDHWDGISLASTPLPNNVPLVTDENGQELDSTKFLSVVGALSYIAIGTRPDISFSVNLLSRFAAKPGPNHWKAVYHLVNYVAATPDMRFNLNPMAMDKPLKCFCDASWGGEFAKSTYGIFVMFLGCPILWASRRQATVASSTCQAEYMALGVPTRTVLWIRNLLRNILKKDYVVVV